MRQAQTRTIGRAIVLAAALALAVSTVGYAWVGTDQPDYSPGSVVTISGGNDASGLPGYVVGNTVIVDATADNGLWEQTCSATVAADETWSCQVTLSSDPAIADGSYHYTATSTAADGSTISETGTFTDVAYKTMTYTAAGTGSGTVTFKVVSGGTNPSSADGGCSISGDTATCTASGTFVYVNGDSYTITAAAAGGSSFAGWSGESNTTACGTSTTPCTTGAMTGSGAAITATFNAVADNTPPTTTITLDPSSPNGSNGWYTSAVTVTVASADSDLASTRCVLDPVTVPASFDDLPASCAYTGSGASVSSEGQHTIYAASIDTTGNKESIKSASFKIDTTAPSLSLSLSESDAYDYVDTATNTLYYNDKGTNTGSFTVTGTANDTVSGIDKVTFPNVFTASDGADDTTSPYSNAYNWTAQESVSGSQTVTAYNGAGLTTTRGFTLTPDTTAPTTSLTGVTDGTYYNLGDTLPTPSCGTATDSGSGVASQDSTPIVTNNRNANGVGSIAYTCSATDKVGNVGSSQATIYVVYSFTGFFQPVDNLPDWNSAKAGSAIPVKFNLDGNQGLDILLAGYPNAKPIACPSGSTSTDPIAETSTAGGSTLTYDTTAMQYIYVWKTQKAWAGKCFEFQLGLNDGTTHSFYVQFTK